MIPSYKDKVILNIKKATGTLEKVQNLVAADAYCMDITQQINAAIGLLRSANNLVVESHLQTCGHRMASHDLQDRQKFIEEILKAFEISGRK